MFLGCVTWQPPHPTEAKPRLKPLSALFGRTLIESRGLFWASAEMLKTQRRPHVPQFAQS